MLKFIKFKKVLLSIIFFSLIGLFHSSQALANNVSGYAWSSNIGWIKFDGVDGVNIKDNGDFEGYAWSSNIGWIHFAPSSGYPISPSYSARVDLATGQVSGWARALAYGSGWTGWIKLRGSNYGVSIDINTGDFSGFGWGGGGESTLSAVIGWIKFDGVKTTFSFTPPINVSNLSWSFLDACVQSRIPRFSWDINTSDPYDYEFRICNDSGCGNILVGPETAINTNSTSWVPQNCFYCCDNYNQIQFNNTYSGQIRARHSGGEWSNWITTNFNTNRNCFPYFKSPPFLCNNENCSNIAIKKDEIIILTDNAEVGTASYNCSWSLPPGHTIISGNPNLDCLIEVKFNDGQNQLIGINVTDNNGYSCNASDQINIRLPLPQWKEVPPIIPIIWLKNFFAETTGFLSKIKS